MAHKRSTRKRQRNDGPPDPAAVQQLERLRRGGAPRAALEHAQTFTASWPGESLGWLVLAEALQGLGREQEAISRLRRGLKEAPDARVRHHLARLLVHTGRTGEARRLYERILEQNPADGEAAHALALLFANGDQPERAATVCERLLAHVPDALRVRALLGAMRQRLGRAEAAAEAYEAALAHEPRQPELLSALASVRREQYLFEAALALYDRALVVQPRSVELLIGRGKTLEGLGRPQEAMQAYSRARAEAPGDPRPRADMANLEAIVGSPAAALELAEETASRIADPVKRAVFRASRLAQAGRYREAADAARHGLEHSPEHAWLWHELASLGAIDDDDAAATLQRLADRRQGSDADRALLLYASARVLDDRGADADEVFRRYREGARLKRRTMTYATSDTERQFAEVRAAFAALPAPGPPQAHGPGTARPVFVVGMPRSGTTLVERILAGHPAVLGTGERENLPVAATESAALLARGHGEAPDVAGMTAWFSRFGDADFARIASRYRDGVCGPADGYRVVVDKYPLNFVNLGLIARALPEARIVLLRRDPLDTCLSYFQQIFDAGHAHSYDLYELGHFHRQFEELVEHWREVLPPDWLLEVDYAQLVNDPPAQVARLLEHCGLEWHDACLQFHQGEGMVRTVSRQQVRQPFYAHALGRAERFRRHLAPLEDGLAGR